MISLLDRSRVEIKLGDYGVANSTALANSMWLPRVQEYRRLAGSRMLPLDADDILKKMPKADYHVSRKVDGEFTVLIYSDGQCLSLNPGGTVRVGLPWQDEAAKLLSNAGIKSAMVAGELYVHNTERRPRVQDVTTVARQPQDSNDIQRLRFAVFDILSMNDENNSSMFNETWRMIEKLFGSGNLVHPVESKAVSDVSEVHSLFSQWVQSEGAEGLVVRSDTAGTFKVKLRHNLDAVVIGFTESMDDRRGLLHDLLMAVMRNDGTLQVLTRVGGGFSDDQRRSYLSDLKDIIVDSEYAEVNSDNVAYQMVRPQLVMEISCLDLISQTTRGGTINRMVLNFKDNGSTKYETVRSMPLATVISPQFVRQREDKSANQQHDVRIEQVSQRVDVPLADRGAKQMVLPQSQLLRREVYTKTAKGETMVRKFVAWKTNKEMESEEYPAFVLHFTDFSPNRKDPLAREVRVSSSQEQIHFLMDEMIAENIKKGWDFHTSYVAKPMEVATLMVSESAVVDAPLAQPATKKPVAKRAAAKKAESEKSPVTKKTAAKEPAAEKPATKKKAATSKPAKKKAVTPKLAPSESTRKKSSKKKSG